MFIQYIIQLIIKLLVSSRDLEELTIVTVGSDIKIKFICEFISCSIKQECCRSIAGRLGNGY